MSKCPTCGDTIKSEQGVKVYHYQAHGESIAWKECEWCEEKYRDPTGNRDRFCSQECWREYQSVPENHPRWEDRVTLECPVCEEEFELPEYRVDERTCCSKECWNRLKSERRRGEDNPAWQGGHPRYYGTDWPEVRKKVIERDEECQRCGSEEDLQVHHIIPLRIFNHPDDANFMENLITLCHTCHMLEEHDKKKVEEFEKRAYRQIEGVGPSMANTLYDTYPTLPDALAANTEELQGLEGVGPVLAERIMDHLHGK